MLFLRCYITLFIRILYNFLFVFFHICKLIYSHTHSYTYFAQLTLFVCHYNNEYNVGHFYLYNQKIYVCMIFFLLVFFLVFNSLLYSSLCSMRLFILVIVLVVNKTQIKHIHTHSLMCKA